MFTVYLGDKLLGTYSRSKENLFLSFCDSKNLVYRKYEEENYIICPLLSGVTIALCAFGVEQDMDKVVMRLADKLKAQGACVLFTSLNPGSNKLMEITNVRILLSFTKRECKDKKDCVQFYHSMRHKEGSLNLVAAIIKRLAEHKQSFKYEIASLLASLLKLKYWRIYLSVVPAVLLECNSFSPLQSECLENAIFEGIVNVYGNGPGSEQWKLINELVKYLEEENVPESENETQTENIKAEEVNIEEAETVTGEKDKETIMEKIEEVKDEAAEIIGIENAEEIMSEEADKIKIEETEEFRVEVIGEIKIEEASEEKVEYLWTVEGSDEEKKAGINESIGITTSPKIPYQEKKNVLSEKGKTKIPEKRRKKISSFLIPPSDGPVYQFASSPRNKINYSQLPWEIMQEEISIFRAKHPSCLDVPPKIWDRTENRVDKTQVNSSSWETNLEPLSREVLKALDELNNLSISFDSEKAEKELLEEVSKS